MKKFVVPAVCALIGCATGVAMPAITAQSYGDAPQSVQRWENYCAFEEAAGNNNLHRAEQRDGYNAVLQRMGRDGWEYVGPVGGNGFAPCFRRRAQ